MNNLADSSRPLQSSGYILLAIALLAHSWIPVLLLMIGALLIEKFKASAEGGR